MRVHAVTYHMESAYGWVRYGSWLLLWEHWSLRPLFSAREGYRRFLHIGRYRFRVERSR